MHYIVDKNDFNKGFIMARVTNSDTLPFVESRYAFEIKVGTPPMSALIKGELGLESGSGNARTTKVGNLTLDQAKKIGKKYKHDNE